MTQAVVVSPWPLGGTGALSFDRTIDRGRVHRSAVSEVFITDVRRLGDDRVVLAAQLPTCHAYFDDHDPATAVDPLLILEVCRQAGLATAYELGLPTNVVLVTGDWDLRVAGPDAWSGGAPTVDLRVDSTFTWTRVRRGRPRAGTCEQHVFAGDRHVATLRASSQFLDYGELEVLRTEQRGTPPPRTADLVARPDPELLQPHVVGRRLPGNVLLAGLLRGEDEVSARVVLPLANRALFDHSYDHVTMQVLLEAARQLAVAAVVGGDGAAAGWHVSRLTGKFTRFAELDAPVTVRAASGAAPAAERELLVVVEQEGHRVAEIDLILTRESTLR